MHPLLIELEREHGNLCKILKHLDGQAKRLSEDRASALEQINLTLEYLHEQPESSHHLNEEMVQQRLMQRGVPLRELADVERDHGALDGIVLQLIDVVRNHPDSRRLQSDLLAYVDRYYRHMRLEEHHLLPAADRLLDHEDWALLEDSWVARDDPIFGARRRRRFMPLALAIHAR